MVVGAFTAFLFADPFTSLVTSNSLCSSPSCSLEVWNLEASNGAGTCGEQISWSLLYKENISTWNEACHFVGDQSETPECRPCIPLPPQLYRRPSLPPIFPPSPSLPPLPPPPVPSFPPVPIDELCRDSFMECLSKECRRKLLRSNAKRVCRKRSCAHCCFKFL